MTVSPTAGGLATLTVTIVTPCGNSLISREYYIGSVFASKEDPPFELVNIDCNTGVATISAETYGAPTSYYWTITEYTAKNTLLGTSNITTTSNILNFTANPQTTHGTICLEVDVNGCGISIPFCYNFSLPCPGGHRTRGSQPLSEHEASNYIEPVLYPNPVKDLLSLRLGEIPKSGVNIEILETSGRGIKKAIYPAGSQVFQIPLSLSPGIYFVRIRYDDKEYVKKIIKQ